MKKNIKFDSIEMLTKTSTGLLVLNTGLRFKSVDED